MSKKNRRQQYDDGETVKASLSTITPMLAERWLTQIPDYQRKVDPKQVDKITAAILKGDWAENGATIVFNEEGHVIDGQHRLHAIVKSGKTVRSLVVRGVSKAERTFQTIGDEKSRKVTDFMHCAHVNNVAAVCSLLMAAEGGKWPLSHEKMPYVEVLKIVRKYQDQIAPIVNAVSEGGRFVKQHSFCTFLVFYYTHIQPVKNPERLAQFFARLGDGVGLEKNDPVYQLRKRYLEQTASGRFDRIAGRAMIVKALHAYLDNKQLTMVRYEPMREGFPELRKSKEA